MVVAEAEFDGFKVGIDAFANRGGFGEIKRRASNRCYFASRNQARIRGQIMIGFELQYVIVDRGSRIAGKVPVAVVNNVQNRWRIGGGFGFPLELVAVIERVGYFDREIARITFFAVFGEIGKFYTAIDLLAGPENFVEAFEAAVQMAGDAAGIIVRSETVFFAVEREFPVLNAVTKTSDRGAEVAGIGQPTIEGIVAVGDIGDNAVFIWDFDRNKDGAVFGDFGDDAVFVREREDFRFTTVG